MSFGNPIWIYLLPVLAGALVALFIWSELRTQRRLRAFAASKLAGSLIESYSPPRRRIKILLTLAAVTLICIALARPRYGVVLEESEARGIDLMIALDTSRSMLAEDISPNRLDRAKLAVLDLVDRMRGDRVGLIAFAGSAFLQCPLTLDYDAFRATLDATDTDSIPTGGTNLAAAIEEASAALDDERNFKLLVILTDGEDLEASGIAAARAAAENGLRIFTVGLGSTRGELIPIRDASGNRSYLRDAGGELVRSALDESTLREIAAVSDGFYAPIGTGGGLQSLYDRLVAELPTEELGMRVQEIPLERYQWPLAAALLLLFLEPLIGTRRRRSTTHTATVSIVLLLALFLPAPDAFSSPAQAVRLYERGEYAEAAEILQPAVQKDPHDARLRYNLGNAFYKLERWEEARREFRAALQTTDPALQADAFFNLGNTLYQSGLSQAESIEGRRQRLALWEEALNAYRNSASLDSRQPDLARNVELVSTAIDALSAVLTVLVEPGEGGEAGTNGRFIREAPVDVFAKAAEGYLFRSWHGAEVANPTAEQTHLVLREDATLTAQFVKTWQLEVLSAQPERGTAGTSGVYPEDEAVTIRAEAVEGYAFDEWITEGAAVTPIDQPEAQVTLTQDAKVTATFVDAYHLDVVVEPAIGGFAEKTGWYEVDSHVPIQAEPRAGFSWQGWRGGDVQDPQAPQSSVELNGHRTVVAQFQREWSLIVLPSEPEGGTVTGGGDFPVGSLNPITATPADGYRFEQWQGPGVLDPSNPETSVRVESSEHDVIAVFTPDDQNQDENQDQDPDPQDPQDSQDDQGEDSPPDSENAGDPEDSENEAEPEGAESPPEDPSDEESNDEAAPPEEEPGEDPAQDESDQGDPEQPDEEPGETPAGDTQEAAGIPGRMTEEEARQLLNALRESEKKLPAVPAGPMESSHGRDW